VFFLSRDLSIESIIEDQLADISYWPIAPKGSAEFLIADRYKDGKALSLGDQPVRFSVSWCRQPGEAEEGPLTFLPWRVRS
jgi:hypothetical protein